VQYLLSEDEMAAIRADRQAEKLLPGHSIAGHLQALTHVVQHIATGFVPEGDTGTAHGCIHVKHPDGPGYQVPYCDHCPVAGICPQPKAWSK
jgi:hypothetical protein